MKLKLISKPVIELFPPESHINLQHSDIEKLLPAL